MKLKITAAQTRRARRYCRLVELRHSGERSLAAFMAEIEQMNRAEVDGVQVDLDLNTGESNKGETHEGF